MSVTETYDTNAQLIEWPPFLEVDVADLVAEAYQRRPDEKRIERITKEFDPGLFGALTVVEIEENRLALVDGQHRWRVAVKLGLETVWVQLHENLTYEERARMFVDLQRKRKNLTAVDKFLAEIQAKDPAAITINRLVEEQGFEIVTHNDNKASGIKAVVGLERIYKLGGEKLLRRTLQTIAGYPTVARYRTNIDLISGTGRFLMAHPQVTPESLHRQLHEGDITTTAIIEAAEQMQKLGGGAQSRAASVEKVYQNVWNGKRG